MKAIELLPSNLPPLPELLPVGSMTSAHSGELYSDSRSSDDDEIIVIYENMYTLKDLTRLHESRHTSLTPRSLTEDG